jgi:N-methylhydantoinase A/acetophenone carboxylase
MEPTVTDADVVLGFIDPDNFLGGKIKLNRDRATAAIKRRISDALNISVEEAAFRIKENAEKNIQKEMLQFLKDKGIAPDELSHYALIAYGGGGPTRYAGFTGTLKFGKILTSPYASVFCAFGFSTTDLLHRYSKYENITLFDGTSYFTDFDRVNRTVNQMIEVANRDIQGEGFSPENAVISLEFIGGGNVEGRIVRLDKLILSSEEDVKKICALFRGTEPAESSVISISAILLNASIPMPHYELYSSALSGEDPGKAFRLERDVYWSPETGYRRTPIYDRELLVPGNKVTGPAVIEAKDTTYVVPAGRSYSISQYSHGVLEEA